MSKEAPEKGLAVFIRSSIKPTAEGLFVLARIDCQPLGIEPAWLIVDGSTDAIALVKPCGCRAQVSLSALLQELSTMSQQHPDTEAAAGGIGIAVH